MTAHRHLPSYPPPPREFNRLAPTGPPKAALLGLLLLASAFQTYAQSINSQSIAPGQTRTFIVTGIPIGWSGTPAVALTGTGGSTAGFPACGSFISTPNRVACYLNRTWDSSARSFTFRISASSSAPAGTTFTATVSDSGSNSAAFTITVRKPLHVSLQMLDPLMTEGSSSDTARARLQLSRSLDSSETLTVSLDSTWRAIAWNMGLAGSPAGISMNRAQITFTGSNSPPTSATAVYTAINGAVGSSTGGTQVSSGAAITGVTGVTGATFDDIAYPLFVNDSRNNGPGLGLQVSYGYTVNEGENVSLSLFSSETTRVLLQIRHVETDAADLGIPTRDGRALTNFSGDVYTYWVDVRRRSPAVVKIPVRTGTVEDSERFIVALSNLPRGIRFRPVFEHPSGASISPYQVFTIRPSDWRLSVTTPDALEGSPLEPTLALNANATRDLDFSVEILDCAHRRLHTVALNPDGKYARKTDVCPGTPGTHASLSDLGDDLFESVTIPAGQSTASVAFETLTDNLTGEGRPKTVGTEEKGAEAVVVRVRPSNDAARVLLGTTQFRHNLAWASGKAGRSDLTAVWTADILDNTISGSPPDPPTVRVELASGSSEGHPATFALAAQPPPQQPIQVTVRISQTGDFAASGQLGDRQVSIPSSGSASVLVATVDDSDDEPNGQITLSLRPGHGYQIGRLSSLSAPVLDDDEPTSSLADPSTGPDPQALSACVPQTLVNLTERYYELNRAKAPNYGANWFKVLLAFGLRTPQQWTTDERAIAPMTAASARQQVQVWSGWRPFAEALECLEKASANTP